MSAGVTILPRLSQHGLPCHCEWTPKPYWSIALPHPNSPFHPSPWAAAVQFCLTLMAPGLPVCCLSALNTLPRHTATCFTPSPPPPPTGPPDLQIQDGIPSLSFSTAWKYTHVFSKTHTDTHKRARVSSWTGLPTSLEAPRRQVLAELAAVSQKKATRCLEEHITLASSPPGLPKAMQQFSQHLLRSVLTSSPSPCSLHALHQKPSLAFWF